MHYDITRCERALAIKGWTKAFLAEKAGLSGAAITKFFRGESVRNDTAKTIITKLGLRMEDVVAASPTVAADVPAPKTPKAERELLDSARQRRA